MRQFTVIVESLTAAAGYVRVECRGPAPVFAPGRAALALADIPGQPFLRVPLYPFQPQSDGLHFWVEAGQPYAALAPGARLDLLGPVGHGFEWPALAPHVLLVGAGLQRLYPLLHAGLARRLPVALLAPPGGDWPAVPPEVEIVRGELTAELAHWADLIALDVPDPAAIARNIRRLRPGCPAGLIQVLLTAPMPCGVGACQACWVETTRGRQQVCQTGPVFIW